jgi:hypothetical protein
MTRDVMRGIVQSPWWIVVGVIVTGAVYATRLEGKIESAAADVQTLRVSGSRPTRSLERDLDSLRIEVRHIGRTVEEIRHLLGRATRSPLGGTD